MVLGTVLQLSQMGAMISVAKTAWQDVLACGKAYGQVSEPSNRDIAWLAFSEAQQVGCLQGWEGCPMVWDAGIHSLRGVCH